MGQAVERAIGTAPALSVRTGIGILLALLLATATLRQAQLIAGLRFDGENSPTESESLFALSRLRAGETLYLDYNRPPHAITAYMPLFYEVTALIAKRAKDWSEMVFVARCTVYIYWVGIGVVIFGLARRAGCARPAAMLAASLWGASQLGQGWANSFRPDAAALFFSLAALWIYQGGRTTMNFAASIGLLMVAFLYKHTVVAPLVVIVVEEIFNRRFRRAAVTAGAWVAMVAVVAMAAQSVTSGRFALNVFVGLNQTAPWSWTWVLLWTSLATEVITFSGATLACVIIQRRLGAGLLKRYFVVSLALAVARSRIFGAWTNHYLEPFAAACVLTGLLAQDLAARDTQGAVRWARVFWLAMALGVSVGLLASEAIEIFRASRHSEDTQWGQFVARLREVEGPVLAEDGYLTVRSGRTPFLTDANKFSHLQRDGKFDDAELVRKIRHGEFAAIITRFPIDAAPQPGRTFPRRWLDPMHLRYQLTGTYLAPEHGVTFYLYYPETIR
jgi:hypothetical protein